MLKEIFRTITSKKEKTEILRDTMYYYTSIVNQPKFKNTTVSFIKNENQDYALNEIKSALLSQKGFAIKKREADERHINLIRQGMSMKDIESHVITLEMSVKKVIAMRGNDTVYFGLTSDNQLILKESKAAREGVLATANNINLTTLKIKTM